MKQFFSTTYRVLSFLACLGIFIAAPYYFCTTRYIRVTYTPTTLSDSAVLLDNPYCGFYKLNGYILSEENTAESAAEWGQQRCAYDPYQLILLEINLKNYANTWLSQGALDQLDQILSACEDAKKQVILRFLYDWDGNALATEPSDPSGIQTHISQLAATINQHADIIFLMQGNFTGNYGEMNNTNFSSPTQVRELMTQLAQLTDSQIYLSVRTPAQLRSVLLNKSPLTSTQSDEGTLASRLGLYNDGMLGSVYDLGSYDDTPMEDSTNFEEQGTREEELAFQDKLCQYVPNGGEVVIDNPYNDLDAAIKDLSTMHVSYLNSDHDLAVLEKWKNSTYSEKDIFFGCTGYEYIQAHLGYRYTVNQSSLDFQSFTSNNAIFFITLGNEGFAPAYRKFNSIIAAYNEEAGKALLTEVDIDNRRIASQDESIFRVSLDIRSWDKGTYQLALVMTDPVTEQAIHFAHDGYEEQDWIPLGTLTIAD